MKEGGGRKHSAREGIKSKNGYNTVFLYESHSHRGPIVLYAEGGIIGFQSRHKQHRQRRFIHIIYARRGNFMGIFFIMGLDHRQFGDTLCKDALLWMEVPKKLLYK
jgi:hypothetical protein